MAHKLNLKGFIAGQTVTWKNKRSQNIHKAEAVIYYMVENQTTGSVYFLAKEEVEELILSGKVEVLDCSNKSFKILFTK